MEEQIQHSETGRRMKEVAIEKKMKRRIWQLSACSRPSFASCSVVNVYVCTWLQYICV